MACSFFTEYPNVEDAEALLNTDINSLLVITK